MQHLFDFRGSEVRVVEIEGAAWFVAQDLYLALDMSLSSSHLSGLSETDKKVVAGNVVPVSRTKSAAIGHGRRYSLVNKAGMYRLIMRSTMPQAEAFQQWVAETVLPSIEEHGIYVRGQEEVAHDPEALDALVHERALGLIVAAIDGRVAQRNKLDAEITALLSLKIA